MLIDNTNDEIAQRLGYALMNTMSKASNSPNGSADMDICPNDLPAFHIIVRRDTTNPTNIRDILLPDFCYGD